MLECLLASIRAQTVSFAEIVVVDDASTDAAPDIARRSGCRVLEMGSNAGFARAVNAGWRAARTEWVAILNSDVELDPAWLERLLEAAGGVGFATGTIVDAVTRNIVDGTYDLVSRAGCASRAGHGEPVADGRGALRLIAVAPATACLFRREVLEKLNGFDESFGSYLEDVDMGLRCVRAGVPGIYVADALARHRGSASFGRWSSRSVRLISRNQVLLIARNYDAALFRSCFWPIVAGQLLWGLVALRHGRGFAWISGKIDGLRGFRPNGQPSPALREFLVQSERELHRRATQDFYWRWYFRFVTVAH